MAGKKITEIYSMHNKGKSVVPERFTRILKHKIHKYMTSVSKNVYIDELDDIVNKYNNAYYSTIKKKPVDVKSNTYINSSKEINNKDPKFKIGDIVRIAKYENIFCKRLCSKLVRRSFCDLKKLETLCRGHTLFLILNLKKLLERFTKKN